MPASNLDEINGRLAETKAELARLDARREELIGQLAELQREKARLQDGQVERALDLQRAHLTGTFPFSRLLLCR